MLTYCTECQGEIKRNALRCRHCGARFAGREAPPQTHVDVEETEDGVALTMEDVLRDVRSPED